MAAGHPLHAEGEDDGHDGRQPFGNGGDGEAECHQEHLVQRLGAKLAEHEDRDGRSDGQQRQEPCQPGDLAFERGLGRSARRERCGDLPHLGLHPDAGHDQLAMPGRHRRSLKHHVQAVAWDSGRLAPPGRALVDRQGLAGQRALVHRERDGLDQPPVGGHDVPRANEGDVATHEVACEQVTGDAVTTAARPGRGHLAEGLQGALGLRLLERSDQGVHDQDGQDHRGVLRVAGAERDDRRGDEQQDDRALELAREQHQQSRWSRDLDQVRTIAFQSLARRLLGQAEGWLHIEVGQYLLDGRGVGNDAATRRHLC